MVFCILLENRSAPVRFIYEAYFLVSVALVKLGVLCLASLMLRSAAIKLEAANFLAV